MKINTGGPAFPFAVTDEARISDGMTLRDYFAAKAMHARLTTYQGTWYGGVAEEAYKAADAMLEEREA
ncbi:MAG: hypothetical protein JW384_03655 [Nitrosomonadaceae bacterium]|nr:hypothetical protein [Nitrosomonadaceae bacterium]